MALFLSTNVFAKKYYIRKTRVIRHETRTITIGNKNNVESKIIDSKNNNIQSKETKEDSNEPLKLKIKSFKIKHIDIIIKYGTKKIYDNGMKIGQSEVIQNGVNGIKRIYYGDKYIDHKKVNSVIDNVKTLKKPVQKLLK